LATFCGDRATLFNAVRAGAAGSEARSQRYEIDQAQTKIEMLRLTRDVGLADWITRDMLPNTANGPPAITVGPMKVGISMIDILTGLYAANAILAALHHRDVRGGDGQHIDLSLLDCGVAALSHYAQNYLVSGVAAPRRGNGGFGGIPSQTFRCADGEEIFVVASTPGQWAALAKVIGRPELADDERFATVSARIAHRDLVLRTLNEVFGARAAADWLPELEAAEVPVSQVNDLDGVFANPQVVHRRLRTTIDHPVAQRVDLLRNPIRLSDTPLEGYRTPPTLGQHTSEILGDVLGIGTDEIARLIEAGALGNR
jgi:crotonobetainyl-CoA:carnitine CoA-transferase CaiB-like acyl-CoA transferase